MSDQTESGADTIPVDVVMRGVNPGDVRGFHVNVDSLTQHIDPASAYRRAITEDDLTSIVKSVVSTLGVPTGVTLMYPRVMVSITPLDEETSGGDNE